MTPAPTALPEPTHLLEDADTGLVINGAYIDALRASASGLLAENQRLRESFDLLMHDKVTTIERAEAAEASVSRLMVEVQAVSNKYDAMEDRAEAAETAAQAARARLTAIDDALDFEPDDRHTIADMANVGKSLMEHLPKHYFYNCSPAEIVTDLTNERDEARARVGELETALRRILDGIPACGSDGSLYVEHFDGEGNSTGTEYVDPLAVIQSIQGVADAALPPLD